MRLPFATLAASIALAIGGRERGATSRGGDAVFASVDRTLVGGEVRFER